MHHCLLAPTFCVHGSKQGRHPLLDRAPLRLPSPSPRQDWLFIAAKRVSAVEYCLLLATFGLVMAFGLEGGIAAGIVLAALHFAYRCGDEGGLGGLHGWLGIGC